MDLQLSDKRALVTGSTSGIGEAIARELVAEGVAVVVHGRSEDKAGRVAEELGAAGRVAVALGDLASEDGAQQVVEVALAAFGGIDILVNNAGAFPAHDWWSGPPRLWAELYEENVISMIRMIQAFAPMMKARGWGRLIQVSSDVGLRPLARMPAYGATKAAVLNLTVSLAKELADTGVTVNAVSPGPILTPGVEEFLADEDVEEMEPRLLRMVRHTDAIARLGQPEEVARAVVFLASPHASYIHGTDLHVDGGEAGTLT